MNNNIIRIAFSSVLIYLSYKKLYAILTKILVWANIEFRIGNETILTLLNITAGLFSILLLILLAKNILTKNDLRNRKVYFLIGLTIMLSIVQAVLIRFYTDYIDSIDLSTIDRTTIFQFTWNKTLNALFDIILLAYFLWQINRVRIINREQ